MGEEQGGFVGPGVTWILDPIDGTFSFLHGVPFYSNLIAVLIDGVPTIGVAGLPGMGILMAAQLGAGLTINGVPYVKPLPNLNRELFATADAYRFYRQGHESKWLLLNTPPFKARTYPDALGYYLLLTGSLTAFVDPMTEVWDVAPFHVILPEAGCRIQSWNGDATLRKGPVVSFRCDASGAPQGCAEILAVLR